MNLIKKIWRPLLALVLISVLIKKGPFDLDQLKFILSQPEILVLGFVIFFFQILMFSVRWKLFVDLVTKTTFSKIIKLNLIGYFFNHFIPGGVGGDIVKALELSKDNQQSKSAALSTVMSDRIFGLFAMVCLTFVFLTFEYFHSKEEFLLKFLLLSTLLLVSIVLCLLFFPIIFKKISVVLSTKDSNLLSKIEKLIGSLNFTFVTFRNINIQAKSFVISLIGQTTAIYFMYRVVGSLNVQAPSFYIFFALSCFGFVASAIPIFPAGIGVGQAAFYALFSNISPEMGKAAITAVTALQIFNFFYALIGGALFSFMPKKIINQSLNFEESK